MARPPSYEHLPKDTRIADLEPWAVLCALCTRCGHLNELDKKAIEDRIGYYGNLGLHQSKLRCTSCKCLGQGEFVVYRARR